MSKPKKSPTPNRAPRHEPADDWRLHQLRPRAHGKGKHPMPHGRYSATKKTLHNGVVARPTKEEVADTLWEICTLSAYHPDGFTWTAEMMAATKHLADLEPRKIRAACIAQADARERAFISR
jgi:hypothetical protein